MLIFIIITLFSSFKIVPTGSTGVKYRFGQISETTVPNGVNFKVPYIDKVVLVNNKNQDLTFEDQIWGEANDKTPLYASNVTVTYQISSEKSAWICANYSDTRHMIDVSLLASAVKSAMVTLNTTDVTNRAKIEPLIKEKLIASLTEKYGEGTISVSKVVVNNMDFEESYNNAIANKSIAQQQYQQQVIDNQKAVEKAEADKQVAIKTAEAAAEAAKIKAAGEAEANNLLTQSLNDKIIKSNYIEKWDGKLPSVVSDSGTMIDLGSLDK